MDTNKKAVLDVLMQESEEISFELSDSDLETVHGGIVIGSAPQEAAGFAIRNHGFAIRNHGFAIRNHGLPE